MEKRMRLSSAPVPKAGAGIIYRSGGVGAASGVGVVLQHTLGRVRGMLSLVFCLSVIS